MFLSQKPSGAGGPSANGPAARRSMPRAGIVFGGIAVSAAAFALALSGAAMTYVSVSSEHHMANERRGFSVMVTPAPGQRSPALSPTALAERDRAALIEAARLEADGIESTEDSANGRFANLSARLRAETEQTRRPASSRRDAEERLAAQLAKRVLTRRLLAARGIDPDEGTAAPVQTASLEEAPEESEIVLELPPARPQMPMAESEGQEEVIVAEVEEEDETSVVALLPDIAPVPERRPDIPRSRSVAASRGSSAVLAYARAEEPEEEEGGVFSGLKKVFRSERQSLPGRGSRIAVYDIKSATVYMPDGTKLEAHSGLGHMKDNPDYYDKRMKGPTPPNIYNLRMREALFHGVEAIRMLPTDHAAMRGRNGILAHTYMLRGTNGSNGCLVFKHYDRFLTAFKAGKVKKIIVVPDMSHLPTYMASL